MLYIVSKEAVHRDIQRYDSFPTSLDISTFENMSTRLIGIAYVDKDRCYVVDV